LFKKIISTLLLIILMTLTAMPVIYSSASVIVRVNELINTSEIANPDSITLSSCKVFQNIYETGDTLFIFYQNVAYAAVPTEAASTAFNNSIYNTAGTTLIASRPINRYNYSINSIYFTAAQTTASLTANSAYVVRVNGNPTLFAQTEGVTMDTITLNPVSDWFTSATAVNQPLLQAYMITVVEQYETDSAQTLLVSVPTTFGFAINTTGTILVLEAIPGLSTPLPTLFQYASNNTPITPTTGTGTYETELNIHDQLGATTENAFKGLESKLFGKNIATVDGRLVAFMWLFLFVITVASIIFMNGGDTGVAIVLSIPILLLGVSVGAMQLGLFFILMTIVVVYLGYQLWLKGM